MIKTLKPNRTRRWVASRIFCGIVYTYTHEPKESRWSILCRMTHIEGTDRRKETGRNEAVYVCRWCSRLLVADRLMRQIIRERANLLNRRSCQGVYCASSWQDSGWHASNTKKKLEEAGERRRKQVGQVRVRSSKGRWVNFFVLLIGDEKWRVTESSIRNKNMNRPPPRSSIFIGRSQGVVT